MPVCISYTVVVHALCGQPVMGVLRVGIGCKRKSGPRRPANRQWAKACGKDGRTMAAKVPSTAPTITPALVPPPPPVGFSATGTPPTAVSVLGTIRPPSGPLSH